MSSRPQVRTSFQLTEVWPITHTVRAAVVSMDGEVITTTTDVQFHIRQHRIN